MRRVFPLMASMLVSAGALAQEGGGGNPFTQNVLNPDISVIGDFSYANVSITDKAAARLAFPGQMTVADRGGKKRGLNFNYLELGIGSAVDPYFDFFAVVTAETDGIGVEEMYVNTRNLPYGFGLRLGKLFSSFGRFNAMHKHVWDFYDAPLVYEAFMGGEGLKDIGGRISWTAPVDFLLQLSFEVFQGQLDGNPSFNANGFEMTASNGVRFTVPDAAVPAILAGNVKTSFDLDDHVFLVGASVMAGPSTVQRDAGDPANATAFFAERTWLYGVDITYKYLISSYRSLTLQSEFLRRQGWGKYLSASGPDERLSFTGIHDLERTHSGLYAQIVWRFDTNGRWRIGARYDLLIENNVIESGERLYSPGALPRYAGMLEFNPTEFSRLRLQYDFDRSKYYEGERKDLQEILFQLTFSIGPHGAHAF